MRPFLPVLLVVAPLLAACSGASEATVPEGQSEAAAAPSTSPPAPPSPPSASSSGSVAPERGTHFPPASGAWETVDAAAAGYDAAKLADVVSFVQSKSSTSFVVLHDGRLLVEQYWGVDASTLRDVASAQKSVVSLLVGAALSKGLFGIDDTVTSVAGPGWSNASAAEEAPITVRHLLTMTSGLDDELLRVAAPGSTWLYNTNAYHCLEAVLEKATAKSLQDLTRSYLFDGIGVGTSGWTKRPFQKDGKGQPISALEMNARDMARVGLLVMSDGAWSGAAVVPSSYLGTALAPSQALNPSYGFLFWLNGQSTVVYPPSSPKAGPLVPSGPTDLVAALGAGDQKIYVSRSAKLVVVRQGKSAGSNGAAGTPFDEELWQRLVAAKLP